MLARTLVIHRPTGIAGQGKRWPVGMLRNKHRAAHVDLDGTSALTLRIAGHTIPLADVLALRAKTLSQDKEALLKCVDHPAAGGGTRESGEQRRRRIALRCKQLYENGHRDFRKIVAVEENCAVETIKSLLKKAGFSTRGLPRA
jgi:hypothetical protein